jgi:4-amino-4-deoxy-L-arabinose transferase-like glycosyltransferase
LLVTTVLYVGHALLASEDPYLQLRLGDEGYYDEWARRIAAGSFLHPVPFFTSPLFAYWLAALYHLGLDSLRAVLLANAALGIAAVAFTWSAARRLAGPVEALVAATMVALGRTVLVYASMPDKTALVLCLAALAMAAAAWADERPAVARWLAAGAAAGIAALAHPLLLVLVPAVAVHVAVRCGVRMDLRSGAAYLAGVLLSIAPATIHNAVVGGELILICSNGGQNLYVGNHAGNLTGLYTAPPFSRGNIAREEAEFHLEAERRHGREMGAGEASSYWTAEALRQMSATPGLTVVRFLRKVRWALGQQEVRDTRTYDFYAGRFATTRLLLWDFGLPAVLGLLGAAAFFRDRRLVLPIAFLALYTGALGVFFVFGRYRLPLLIPLSTLAGVLVVRARTLLGERSPSKLAALTAAAVAASVLVFGRALPDAEGRFFADFYAQGQYDLAIGRTDEALVEFEKAITVNPGDQPAVTDVALRLSTLYRMRGDRAAARRVLEAALRARPADSALAAARAAVDQASP